mmetsp:Transcript_20700/g.54101  ORF Transcript_20700/g.54101 Transcript_20700/m.54101 type:complete len:151 (+) Transcript_20700:203-655(+)|eukprot:jgi/Tetstr1/448502/TSEL_035768.t1
MWRCAARLQKTDLTLRKQARVPRGSAHPKPPPSRPARNIAPSGGGFQSAALHRRAVLALELASVPLCFGAVDSCDPAGGELAPELAWPRRRRLRKSTNDAPRQPPADETTEERRQRVSKEVQQEYERRQLQEELRARNQELADAAWQSLE